MKQEIIKLFKAVVVCSFSCIGIAVGVAILLRTPLFASQQTYLYRLLILTALCCAILLFVLLCFWGKHKQFLGLDLSNTVLCIGLSTVFMAWFFSLGPMTIERSYTIYSLADMADHPEVIYSAEEIKEQFIDGYIVGANASKKRVDEQIAIGNLEEVSGGYRIGEKGQRLVKIFRLVEVIFPVPDESSIYPNGK